MEVSASLISLGDPYSYAVYVCGISFEVTPTTVSEAISLPLVPNHFCPTRRGIQSSDPNLDFIADTHTGGKLKKWTGKLYRRDLMLDYPSLFLAISNTLFFINHLEWMDAWRARVVFGIGTNQPICVSRYFIDYL